MCVHFGCIVCWFISDPPLTTCVHCPVCLFCIFQQVQGIDCPNWKTTREICPCPSTRRHSMASALTTLQLLLLLLLLTRSGHCSVGYWEASVVCGGVAREQSRVHDCRDLLESKQRGRQADRGGAVYTISGNWSEYLNPWFCTVRSSLIPSQSCLILISTAAAAAVAAPPVGPENGIWNLHTISFCDGKCFI